MNEIPLNPTKNRGCLSRRLLQGCLAVVVLMCIGCLGATAITVGAWRDETPESVTLDGEERFYRIHVPDNYDPNTPVPLVVMFHGGGGHAVSMETMSGMNAVADRENFIVVYPNGSGFLRYRLLTWNAADNCCGYALDNDVDDISFVQTLVEQVQKDYAIDPARIYASGMSNGGMMSYRVACELPTIFAAVAPVAGALNLEDCSPTEPISVLIIHGLEDKFVHYEGGRSDGQENRTDNSVDYAFTFWRDQNACPDNAFAEETVIYRTEQHNDCADNTSVWLYAIKGEGHTWPGGVQPRILADEPTQDFDASAIIWEFFAAHPKSRP